MQKALDDCDVDSQSENRDSWGDRVKEQAAFMIGWGHRSEKYAEVQLYNDKNK